MIKRHSKISPLPGKLKNEKIYFSHKLVTVS